MALAALMLAGCKSGERATADDEAVPPDLKVVFGMQGSARMQGHSISADGTVSRWEGLYPEQNVQARSSADREEVRRLWQQVQRVGFLDMEEQAMAQSFWFITVSANGKSRRVTWIDRTDQGPVGAQALFDACLDVARKALAAETAPDDYPQHEP
jgi:hypothetical protein